MRRYSRSSAYAKKLRESAAEFEKLGRADAARTIEAEMAVVREYLPTPLTPTKRRASSRPWSRMGASSPKDLGRVMKEVTARAQGRADGKALSELARHAYRREPPHSTPRSRATRTLPAMRTFPHDDETQPPQARGARLRLPRGPIRRTRAPAADLGKPPRGRP